MNRSMVLTASGMACLMLSPCVYAGGPKHGGFHGHKVGYVAGGYAPVGFVGGYAPVGVVGGYAPVGVGSVGFAPVGVGSVGFAPVGFAPVGVGSFGMAGTSTLNSGVNAQGIFDQLLIDILRRTINNNFNTPNRPSDSDLEARFKRIEERLSALEDKKEEAKQARMLLETHDEVLKKHDALLKRLNLVP